MTTLARSIRRAWRSIAVRLSTLLLAVFVFMFAGIALQFNAILGREFDNRADTELYGKIELVQRVLGEMPATGEISVHRQHFDELLRGQHRLLLAILGRDGAALYRSPGFDALGAPVIDSIRAQIEAGREGDLKRPGNGPFFARTARGWVGGSSDAPVWIAVAVDVRDHRDVLKSHGETMLIALLLGALATTAGGLWMIRRGLAPVRRLAAAEARISAGRLEERIQVEYVPLELNGLVDGFNSMLDRLHDSFRRLSEFSSDLAHELRTPINSLIGHAQVALSRPRSAEEYATTMEVIAEDGERVARIVREMLFLAQADNAAAVVTRERVDLRAEFDSVAAYFAVLASERGISIACEGQGQVTGDRLMLQRAIGNLLSNALWHTPADETIRARIASDARGTVSLEVNNPGPGIPAEHLPRIFDRFYQVTKAGEGRADRTGLGLAIVKSIMALHGGSAMAASMPGVVTTFRLEFPPDPGLRLGAGAPTDARKGHRQQI